MISGALGGWRRWLCSYGMRESGIDEELWVVVVIL
jgi:hypothetical protein